MKVFLGMRFLVSNLFKITLLLLLANSCMAKNQSLDNGINQCRAINNNQQRLSCYDQLASKNAVDEVNKEQSQQDTLKMPVLLADLEEPRMFGAYGSMNFLNQDINVILLGIGTRAKLKTIDIPRINQSVDFNIIGLIKSQFDVSELDVRNNREGALINTDFVVGGELSKNFRQGSLRLKYTHQSYHLGDEFLIDNPFYLDKRLNLSYETLEFLGFRKSNQWGVYAGGSLIVRAEPAGLGKFKLQSGFQYHGKKRQWFTPLFGADFKAWGETDWQINTSIKAGVEFYGFLDEPLQFMFEYYDGKSPYGQFIYDDLRFVGLSINHYW